MIAVPGNSNSRLLASLNQSRSRFNIDLFSVNCDFYIGRGEWSGGEGPPGRRRSREKSARRLQAP